MSNKKSEKETKALRLLKELNKIDFSKLPPVHPSYWEEEDKLIEKQIERSKKIDKQLKMSHEKFHRPFDL